MYSYSVYAFKLDRKSLGGWAPSDTSGDFFGNKDFATFTATDFSSGDASYSSGITVDY